MDPDQTAQTDRDFIFLRLHMLPAQESLLVKH